MLFQFTKENTAYYLNTNLLRVDLKPKSQKNRNNYKRITNNLATLRIGSRKCQKADNNNTLDDSFFSL